MKAKILPYTLDCRTGKEEELNENESNKRTGNGDANG